LAGEDARGKREWRWGGIGNSPKNKEREEEKGK
jgi:hypothetical protein